MRAGGHQTQTDPEASLMVTSGQDPGFTPRPMALRSAALCQSPTSGSQTNRKKTFLWDAFSASSAAD